MNIIKFKKKYKDNIKDLILYYKNLEKLIKINENLNFYTYLRFKKIFKFLNDEKFIKKYKDKPLFGIPFFVKDNFWVNDSSIKAGSEILKGFKPNIDSSVVEILKDSGAILVGITRMDELGLGGTGIENIKPVINPIDNTRIVGGSTSGSAVAEFLTISNGFYTFSLGSDTGDSARVSAAFLGIIGFKPSFGLISRRGVVSYSPSLDTVGILSGNIDILINICKIIFKKDELDFVSQEPPKFKEYFFNKNSKLKIGFFNDQKFVSKKTNKMFNKFINNLEKETNFEIKELLIEKKILDSLSLVYQMISYPEAISSQSNLTGINFLNIENESNLNKTFDEQVIENRTKFFRDQIKRRYVIGSYFQKFDENNETFYLKGQKIRRYINDYFLKIFEQYDFLIFPATFDIAPTIKEINEFKNNPINSLVTINDLLLISNFTGTPSIIIPMFKKKLNNFSINVTTKFKDDYKLLDFSIFLERFFKNENF